MVVLLYVQNSPKLFGFGEVCVVFYAFLFIYIIIIYIAYYTAVTETSGNN